MVQVDRASRVPIYLQLEEGIRLGIRMGELSPGQSLPTVRGLAEKVGVNPNTVWTWNAIGKRSGAWNLDKNAPEAKKGFLLNHIISDLLPPREDGHRYSNSDPVTGQAAWFDLRVKIEKAAPEEFGETWPQFDATEKPPGMKDAPDIIRYGKDFKSGKGGK